MNDPPNSVLPKSELSARNELEDRKGGFPHSEISGSKGARASPELIAACHVLHRLSTPRHPSEALMRLIVLSKTHAWGSVCLEARTKEPQNAHTCASICICQTMMSTQVRPPNAVSSLGGAASAGLTLQFTMSFRRRPFPCGDGDGNSYFRDRAGWLVEPDGIEPTTSCLQSTRSTN